MSTSEKQAAEELKNALKYGRCPICDRIKCEDLEGGCTCCIRCGNSEASCTCCPYCLEPLNLCACFDKLRDIWSIASYCALCPSTTVHQDGQPCPLCCCKCKEIKQYCSCCQKCRTTPCICCTRCGDLRVNCRCWGAKILSHFMRRAVLYHKNQQELRQFNFPVNTATLITFSNE
jgi:hypothetical protein